MESNMRLRCKVTGFYIHELRGACYVSWVAHNRPDLALEFPKGRGWLALMERTTGVELQALEACTAEQFVKDGEA